MPLPLTPPLRRLQRTEEVKREGVAGGSDVARRWGRQGEAGEAWRGGGKGRERRRVRHGEAYACIHVGNMHVHTCYVLTNPPIPSSRCKCFVFLRPV
jgi:hypothetical protein